MLLGAPGSGKGTFSAQIKKVLPDIIHVSTGDIFRENVKNNTELGKKAKSYMDRGELVPDSLVIDLVIDRLKKKDVLENGFILDGFPRNIEQSNALQENSSIDIVLLLEVDRDVITKRILGRFGCDECGEIYNKYTLQPKVNKGEDKWLCDKCGAEIKFKQRSDDTEETLKTRLDAYEKNAKPLIEFYEKKKVLKKVNAENTLDLTAEDLKKIVEL